MGRCLRLFNLIDESSCGFFPHLQPCFCPCPAGGAFRQPQPAALPQPGGGAIVAGIHGNASRPFEPHGPHAGAAAAAAGGQERRRSDGEQPAAPAGDDAGCAGQVVRHADRLRCGSSWLPASTSVLRTPCLMHAAVLICSLPLITTATMLALALHAAPNEQKTLCACHRALRHSSIPPQTHNVCCALPLLAGAKYGSGGPGKASLLHGKQRLGGIVEQNQLKRMRKEQASCLAASNTVF